MIELANVETEPRAWGVCFLVHTLDSALLALYCVRSLPTHTPKHIHYRLQLCSNS